MFLLFLWHNITPGDFFAKGEGERKLLYAFIRYEITYRMEKEKAQNRAWAEFLAKIHGAK